MIRKTLLAVLLFVALIPAGAECRIFGGLFGEYSIRANGLYIPKNVSIAGSRSER